MPHDTLKNQTKVDRISELELSITRTFNAPARTVFDAWTQPELLKQWWATRSSGMTLLSCETDIRPGGAYRFVFGREDAKTMAFFGQYLEATPPSRLVWTNEECPNGAITTVTFEEKAGQTLLVLHERYASKEALDASIAGMEAGMSETFQQLDDLLLALAATAS